MPILLLTRPLAQSTGFLVRVTSGLGRDVPHLVAPLSRIVPSGVPVPQQGDLILTSGRAAELAGAAALAGRRAWCVGDATAALARAAGAVAHSAAGDAVALLAMLLAEGPNFVRAGTGLVHLRGEDAAADLVTPLRVAGILAEDRVLYRAERLPLSDEAASLLAAGTPVLAPVFSPRAAAFLAEDAPRPPAEVIAISAAAARPFAGHPAVTVVAAPDGNAMLNAVLRRLGGLP